MSRDWVFIIKVDDTAQMENAGSQAPLVRHECTQVKNIFYLVQIQDPLNVTKFMRSPQLHQVQQ